MFQLIIPMLTAKAPKNGWLEFYFRIGFRPIFRWELLVSGRVILIHKSFCLQYPRWWFQICFISVAILA